MASRWLPTLIGSLALSGCFPLPYMRNVSPAISGVLHRNGARVAEREVLVSFAPGDVRCEMAAHTTLTDFAGAFEFPGRRKLSLFDPITGSYADGWSICAGSSSPATPLWSQRAYGRGASRYGRLHLDCDLSVIRRAGTHCDGTWYRD